MNFRWEILLFFWLIPWPCAGQVENDNLMGQITEYISENVSEDMDYSEITERLSFYRKYPLNINKVDKEQLKELLFISPVHIEKIIAHRQENGLFQDILELQSIDGFDSELSRWLMNFVFVSPPDLLSGISLGQLINKSNHDFMIRFGKVLEKQKGFISSDSANAIYSGSADRVFARYRFNYADKISVSVNMEKDAGEAFFGTPGNGFDFYSANVSLRGGRFVKKFVVGDYALQFGQGLTMWSGLGFGKGAGLITVAKQAIGLRPYSSVNESSFLRGASATLNHNRVSLTPFFSFKKLDASLSDNGYEINSMAVSGLHRTTAERETKNSVSQLVYGINSTYQKDGLNLGVTAYRTLLNIPIAKGSSLYERYHFSNRSLINLGYHYTYTYKNSYFFGEIAHSLSSGSAFLNGIISSLSSKVSGVLLYRNYARNYHSFFNQGLSESTNAINEKGFYTGLAFKFNRQFELISYFDFFRFPWLKFRVDAPSEGHELFAQLVYNLNKKFKITGRFKYQQKEENSDGANTGGLENVVKQNYRIELIYKAGDSFSFRNRAEISFYRKGVIPSEFGVLSYQDMIYRPLSSKFSGNIRFALFNTPSFNSRIYAYENDVLYGYSVPAYQGKGLRCYINGRYTPYRGVDLWLRYALLSYSDQETIGSGNDLITGSQRSDVKVQLRFQF